MPEYRLERPIINGKQSASWYIVWTEGRRSRRFSTKAADKVEARKILARFAAAEDAPPETFTISDLCDAYLKDREEDPRVHYPKAIRNSLSHIKRHFGDLGPTNITPLGVKTYIKQRRKAKVADATISKELRFLRQALKYGVNNNWIDKEPKIDLPGEGVPRDRFLTRSEFAQLFFHASPFHLRVFLALAISTGQRGKHILTLTWDRVDFDSGMIMYRPGKSANKRTAPIPMNTPLRAILTRASECRGKSGHVVEWRDRPVLSVRKAYEGACRRAGLEDAHRHDLRRTAASWAVQDGNSIETVATMLGDTVETARKHYTVFDPNYLRGVVGSIAGGRR